MTLRLRTAPLAFRMRRAHRDAAREVSAREGVLVALEIDGTLVGLGEASPLPGYSDEPLERVRDDLASVARETLATAHAAVSSGRFDAATEALSHLVPSARCAIQVAMLDAHARARGLPLSRTLGAEGGERVPALLADASTATASAVLAALGRARAVKLKVGRSPDRELALATELRAGLDPAVELRFDANRSLDPARDAAFVASLARLGPCLFEEPFADAHASSALVAASVAFDESLRDCRVVADLASRTPAALVLKPTTLGFLEAHALARRALTLGARAIVSHTCEGAVGFAALVALALSLPEPAPGLDSTHLDSRDGLAEVDAEGVLQVSTLAGLGVDRARILAEHAWT